jgi:DNA-binding MarR family transcriptional regulator
MKPRAPARRPKPRAIDGSTRKFLQAVWRMEHALERASKRMEDAIGVTGPQRFALRLIALHPGLGAADLAAALHLHPGTITGMIQRLQARGYVARTAHASDKRRMHLHLTRAGERVNASTQAGTVESAVRRTLARCDDAQCDAAIDVLDDFASELLEL